MFSFNLDRPTTKTITNLDKEYDVVIIGAGPGGFNTALYAHRKGLSVIIITKTLGGQLTSTSLIENYLGINNVTGDDLTASFVDHVNDFKIPIMNEQYVTEIKKENDLFHLTIENGQSTISKTVVIATGGIPRKLNIPGEAELIGRSISYCAICDGPFYKDNEVVVIGGGNSAIETAIDLAKIAKSVTVIELQKRFNADKVLVDQLLTYNNVKTILNAQSKEFISENNSLKSLKYIDLATNEEHTLDVEGAFIEIGVIPNSNVVKDLVELNRFGEVMININQETSLEGMYAVGDVTDFPFKQIVIAASQGAVAALSLNNYINTKEQENEQ